MKFRQLIFSFFAGMSLFFAACNETNTTATISSDASIRSIVISNSKVPKLSSAVFTLVGDTLVNLDSLPYKTDVDSVVPTLIFVSSKSAYLYKTINADKILYTGKDTLDLRNVVKMENLATDEKSIKTYYIKVNVHKVEPELYVWNKILDKIGVNTVVSQKALLLNESLICYYLNDGSNNYLYTSENGSVWKSEVVTGLPTNCKLENITLFNSKFYVSHNNMVYSSGDGMNWVESYSSDKYSFKSILYEINGYLWLVAQSNSDNKLRFATLNTNSSFDVHSELPSGFPVTDFSSLTYTSRIGKPKSILVGGKDINDKVLRTSWGTENGVDLVSLQQYKNTLDSVSDLLGASIISYDNNLLLFSGNIGTKEKCDFLVSKNEGLSWNKPDSIFNYRVDATNFKTRNYSSVLVHRPLNVAASLTTIQDKNLLNSSNNIFVIGGKSKDDNVVLTDVWKGKLNRKAFIRQ